VDLLGDPFIAQYLGDLLRSVRLKATEAIFKPYKAVRLNFLAEQLNVELPEVRSLLAELILEERIKG
jgi:COP9 signalosome complex subunit 2